MKRIILLLLVAAVLVTAAIGYFRFLAPTTLFNSKFKYLYIHTNEPTRKAVLQSLAADSMVGNAGHFDWLAAKMDCWQKIKPGKYRINQGMSMLDIARLLRNGIQTPSRLVINKFRLQEDFARLLARNIENDSAQVMTFLQSPDSLARLGVTPNTWATLIIPDTYEVYWTSPVGNVLEKLKAFQQKWWDRNDRLQKAEALGLTPTQVYILASVVEEETNVAKDKPLVASVYLNRIRKGMPLQADPTIRYALKDFKMNRILHSHLTTPSPYNTYLNRGLPPGPICTPSQATLDSVLSAPKTDYIFFVANADLRGGSTFTTNLTDHNRAARLYQDSLKAWLKRKALKEAQEKAEKARPS